MFIHEATLWAIALRSLIVYLVILVGLRLTRTRVLGQGTLFDLVLVLLISNAVQNAMVGDDYSVDGGLVSLATIFVANLIVVRASLHVDWLRHLKQGEPMVVIQGGHLVATNVAHQHLSWEQLDAAVRQHGIGGIQEVQLAVLEVDGSISVLPMEASPIEIGHARRRMRGRRRSA